MSDHTWMRDTLIDVAMHADSHGMEHVLEHVSAAIEEVLKDMALLGEAQTGAAPSTSENVVELASWRTQQEHRWSDPLERPSGQVFVAD